jgi:hypothetical protein
LQFFSAEQGFIGKMVRESIISKQFRLILDDVDIFKSKVKRKLLWPFQLMDFFQQIETLTQHRMEETSKSDLQSICPVLGDLMLTNHEWSEMDRMFLAGINSFMKSSPIVNKDTTFKTFGTVQALSCVLGEWNTSTNEIQQNIALFCRLPSDALQDLYEEILMGLQAPAFEVVSSSLSILCHWLSSKNGSLAKNNRFKIKYL